MRISASIGLIAVVLLLPACQQASPTTPQDESHGPASAVMSDAEGATLLATYRLDIDPDTLTATVTPHRTGSAQPPQGQRYDLDIANFQNANSLRITGVQVLGSGNFRVTFTHAHPFPAPNVANPASATNRADLGYTGRLLLLTTYNPKSFFSGAVRMSAGAVLGPDGYVETGDLLANSGPSLVTAYPYKLLADEAQDNRTDVSNGGDPEGNYAAGSAGWQRINLGAAGTAWTGFDYVHGGQTVTNTFTLSKEALEAANFSLDAALLIQYTDPRGSGGATNRLPAAAIDPLAFAYRLPYAALDCSRVIPTANLTLTPVVNNSATLEVRVRDWDAGADEAADNKVGDESAVDLVQAGGSGNPEVVLDAPGILSAGLRNMGSATSGTGASDSPLLYSNSLPNQTGAPAGTYYACLRVTDPEFALADRGTYHAGVDASTLIPSAARAVPARTWQIVPIMIGPDVPVVQSVFPTGIVGGMDEDVTFSASATNSPTSWSWNFGGGASPNTSSDATPTVQLASTIGTFTGSVIATNAGGDSQSFSFQYRVLAPQQPGWNTYQLAEITSYVGDGGTARHMTLFNGKPALVISPQHAMGPMQLALATVPVPESPADWAIHDVLPEFGRYAAPFVLNGKLAIAYTYDDEMFVDLRLALTDATVPDATSDWRHVVARSEPGDELNGMAVEYNGRVAIVYQNTDDNRVAAVFSSNLTPESPDDFAWCEVRAMASSPSIAIVSGDTDPRPMVACVDTTDNRLLVLQSVPELPVAAGNWFPCGSFDHMGEPRAVALLGYDRPGIGRAAILSWIDPDTAAPMVAVSSGSSFSGYQSMGFARRLPGYAAADDVAITLLNNRLAIATQGAGQLQLSRGLETGVDTFLWAACSFPEPVNVVTDVNMVATGNRYVAVYSHNTETQRFYSIAVSTGPY